MRVIKEKNKKAFPKIVDKHFKLKMIEIGEVNLGDNEVEYSNSAMKLKINNGDFKRGGIMITSR